MIPDLLENGLLPVGIHPADWNELVYRFSWTKKRRSLLDGLEAALTPLRAAGCLQIYINGSFTTAKDEPDDIDCAWDPNGVDVDRLQELEPVFFIFTNKRKAQKEKFGCEFFPAGENADGASKTFLDFFQIDRDGQSKGIICLKLQ